MRPPHLLLALLSALLPAACSSPEGDAERVFAAFQDALFGGDRRALAALLARDSLQALESLPLDRAKGKQRLVVTGVTPHPPEWHIAIRDPNEQGKSGTFVVVREEGRLVVDLVRTTAFHHERTVDASARRSLQPRALTAQDLEYVRRLR